MFKILRKPLKWLLGIIIFLIIMIAIPIALLYKSVTPPTISDEEVNLESYLLSEVDDLIDPTNEDKSLNLMIDENLFNSTIHKQLVKQFGESVETEDPNYIYKDENVMFQGVWLEFGEDTINIVAGAHANARIFTFKTRVLISFKILENKDNPGELALRLDKFKVGNLSLKWVLKSAPKIAENILGQDIDSFIENAVGSFAKYNSSKMELTVNLYELTEQLEDNKDLAALLLDIIYDNELLQLGVLSADDVYKLGVKLNLNKIADDSLVYILPEQEKINSEAEFNSFLYNKALAGIVSSTNAIQFNSLEMNKVIDYVFKQSSEMASEYLMKSTLYKDYEAIIGNPYIEITDKLTISVPIKIGKDTSYFETKFKLTVNLRVNDNDLVIEFKESSIGELLIDEESIKEILDLAGQENIVDNQMTVTDFFVPFKDAGIEVTSINIVNNKLLFHFEGLNINNILDDIQTTINNPDLNDKVNEIIGKIDNDQEITEEDIQELIEIMEGLTETEIENLQDIINNYLE